MDFSVTATTSSLSKPSAASLDAHINCFPLLQPHTPLCFSISNDIRVLDVQNEMNGYRTRNASGRGKELLDTSHSCSFFVILARNEERTACSNGKGKEGGYQKQIQRRAEERDIVGGAKDEDEDEGERRAQRKEGGEKSGGDDDDNDELQQWFCLFDSALSSSQLHTQNITSPSTFASLPFSPLPHSQFSATSVLIGTQPKPFTPSSLSADSSSLTQKSFCTSNMSYHSLSPSFSISSFSPPLHVRFLGKADWAMKACL
ncbi:uncharacterized protein MONOS_11570 [Monocercomonoides exilis]|uniref:uncharacterized protein n=1 Tax=Monocercomonoides exilis TaxID=2049356 RepID=UPI00355A9515|nr:hypothetical protein MONOS_11570 [Monocercomonoides exilis]|eukprot:MONOS_11570.1-p1 / transcript=MONOS_11570.1 / gene=MONOS_11570 / organism=Monocercomonoides_exilis_PA203 / gene_product=unspecified product / transcript_product=unspecified product / location=Mono_scaffold00587:36117-37089(-) / protein_length=259 / sequence_SO=supercontig / SO=protein_coding / is_pseudo=false